MLDGAGLAGLPSPILCSGVLASCMTVPLCKRITAPAQSVLDPPARHMLHRDSDASKASVRRMVGLAFAKAITTEGKSLGEVTPPDLMTVGAQQLECSTGGSP